jgi:hypothetical protein
MLVMGYLMLHCGKYNRATGADERRAIVSVTANLLRWAKLEDVSY